MTAIVATAPQTRRGIWSCVGYAYVRADTHVCNSAGGGWWKEAKADVVVVIVDVKIK